MSKSTEQLFSQARTHVAEARALIDALNKSKGEPGSREWVLSIPANDRDPDIVFGNVCTDLLAAIEGIEVAMSKADELAAATTAAINDARAVENAHRDRADAAEAELLRIRPAVESFARYSAQIVEAETKAKELGGGDVQIAVVDVALLRTRAEQRDHALWLIEQVKERLADVDDESDLRVAVADLRGLMVSKSAVPPPDALVALERANASALAENERLVEENKRLRGAALTPKTDGSLADAVAAYDVG